MLYFHLKPLDWNLITLPHFAAKRIRNIVFILGSHMLLIKKNSVSLEEEGIRGQLTVTAEREGMQIECKLIYAHFRYSVKRTDT